ncbi:unnamed protein product [Somion occarium]|uniref:BZIP domain-containing protein n=1 Tax=Somion occarium TaxID=3059160 RepID=A0ABP1DHK2_9APHY
MTRGRRKDLTIPPSRALLQQRDYRARKAQYLADLEDRVRRAEGENVELKEELDQLKARLRQENGGDSAYGQELVEASSDLMQHLAAASTSLARFQRLALDKPLVPPDIRMDTDEPMTSSRSLPPPRAPPISGTMPTLSASTSLQPPPPGYATHSHSSQNQYQQSRSADHYLQTPPHTQSARPQSNYTLHPGRLAPTNGYATPSQSNHPSPYAPPSPTNSSRSGDSISRMTASPRGDQLPSLHQLNLPPPLRLRGPQHAYAQHPSRLHPDPNPPYPNGNTRSPPHNWADTAHDFRSREGRSQQGYRTTPGEESDSESDDDDHRNIPSAAPVGRVGRLSLVTSDVRSGSSSSSGSERA